ncbi:apolipoprotein L3-like isoform X2 [Dicentrarchus labrax]|uniref:apolipoprotein L3-like isoform X2 n=1 Tax=Dicentrarchus labrax TaxID=13489 RepID=UPI0021F58CB7|nr:apolipoprotein L3-like isoform X2 [Dicentrarchus labrax]
MSQVMADQSIDDKCKAQPPPLAQRLPKNIKQLDNEDETLDDNSLLDWWKDVTPWKFLCKDLKLKERKVINIQAEHLYKAVRVYILLLSEHVGFLKQLTEELLSIADNLNNVSKGTKIAGITGGATSVAGGVAAAAGVILSPFTLGFSMALTVVGVGVAAVGGVTGASAAIANKVIYDQDKKKIEKAFQDYEGRMKEIRDCVTFIGDGIERLRQHDLSLLDEARKESVRVGKMVELATTGGGSTKAIETTSGAFGLMEGFAHDIGIHFTQGKDGQKQLKKGHESALANKLRSLAENLNNALEVLMEMKEDFIKRCPTK